MGPPFDALFSTLDRMAAWAQESDCCGRLQQRFFDKLITNIKNRDQTTANVEKWDP